MGRVNLFVENRDKVIQRLKELYESGADPAHLDPEEKQFIEAIEQAHSLMVSNRCNREATKNHLLTMFEYKIGPSTAYWIVDLACLLKATESVAQHKYHKFWLSENLKKQMELAEKKGDFKQYAKLAEIFMKLHRLDEEVDDKTNFADLFQGMTIEISNDTKLLPYQYTPEEEAELFRTIGNVKEKAKKQRHGIVN